MYKCHLWDVGMSGDDVVKICDHHSAFFSLVCPDGFQYCAGVVWTTYLECSHWETFKP